MLTRYTTKGRVLRSSTASDLPKWEAFAEVTPSCAGATATPRVIWRPEITDNSLSNMVSI